MGLLRSVSRPNRERGFVSQILMFLVVSGLCGVLLAGLAIPLAGALGIGAKTATDTFESLPSQLDDPRPPEKTTILAADGSQIAVLFDDNRVNLESIDDISKEMQDAIVAIEDQRFYEHGAMDLRGTMRAFVRNQQAGGVSQGGSTITQQYVKAVLIENATTPAERREAIDDTYERKLQELRFAITLEERMSKDDILRKYLNIVYFGSGTYGVEAAAKHYFNTTAKELTLPQAAMLAGMVRDPNGFDPVEEPDQMVSRRNLVIANMASQGMISEKAAKEAQRADLGLDLNPTRNGCYYAPLANFFCDYVQEKLLDDPALGATEEERRRFLYQGGLTITTTLSLKSQHAAEAAVRDGVQQKDRAISAISMVRPGTGGIAAMAQSKPMGSGDNETFVNFNVEQKYNGSYGWQPGSSFKTFVLAAAIQQGVPLTRTFPAPSGMTHTGPMSTCPEGQSGQVTDDWEVGNSTDPGGSYIDLVEGTVRSVNTFYANLENETGVCDPAKIATALGATRGDGERLQQYKSFVLGVNEVPPLHMAEAYAAFAAGGEHCTATPLVEVLDRDGQPINVKTNECSQAIPKDVADGVNYVLTKVTDGSVSGATGTNMAIEDWQVAGKTGTNDSNKAVWFMGYTTKMATASVVATPDNTSLVGTTINGSYISQSEAYGGTLAGPIWLAAMEGALASVEPKEFDEPDSDTVEGVPEEVPDVLGKSQSDAEKTIRDAGFNVAFGGYVNSSYPEGAVAQQSPGGGVMWGSGQTVLIHLSNGEPYIPPPPPDDDDDDDDKPKPPDDDGPTIPPPDDDDGGNRGPKPPDPPDGNGGDTGTVEPDSGEDGDEGGE